MSGLNVAVTSVRSSLPAITKMTDLSHRVCRVFRLGFTAGFFFEKVDGTMGGGFRYFLCSSLSLVKDFQF